MELPDDDPPGADETLAEEAQGGSARALEVLLERHETKVLRVLGFLGVPAQEREDVAQEVFIRVFRHLGSFRRGLPFGGWLYRMTVNAAHDHRRRRERVARDEVAWSAGLDPADRAAGPAAEMDRRETRQALRAALLRLSSRERAVFVLREIEGLETGEVARTLGISSITVRRHLGRARRRLERDLRSFQGVDPLSVERIVSGGSSHR